jgi:prepilin-type N-terminal cleavage/methylation domain-containing protein
MKKSSKGFSLIELLIVVAIILIIAAIAIPNLLRSRIAANQASAVGSLRTLNTAEITYSSTFNVGFTSTLLDLQPPSGGSLNPTSTAAGLIDSVLSGQGATTSYISAKSGYAFTYTPGPSDSTGRINLYGFTAIPISSSTGTNYYFTDQSGVIRQNSTTTASSTDSPIAG